MYIKTKSSQNILTVIGLVWLLSACSSNSNKINVQITLQTNGSLKITGPDPAVLGQIQRDSVPWHDVFPVYRTPADTDMKDFQPAQAGKYLLKNSSLFFIPDTPFAAGQTYFLRYYHFGEGGSAWKLIRNRQKLGTKAYTDLTFKK